MQILCKDVRILTGQVVLIVSDLYLGMLNGDAVAWKSKRQSVVALSTAEEEFFAVSVMVQEVIYIRRCLENLDSPQKLPTLLY